MQLMRGHLHRITAGSNFQDPLFLRHFRQVVTLVAGLTLALALSLFFCFERLSRANFFDSAMTMLSQSAKFTSDLIDICTQITLQIQEDTTISPILMQSVVDSGKTNVSIDQLTRYQYIIKSLRSIYIVNNRTGKVYISTGIQGADNKVVDLDTFPDQSAIELVQHYEDYNAYTAVPRQYAGENYYTFLGYDFTHKAADGSLNSAVLVNVSANWLEDTSPLRHSEGEMVIIKDDGTVVSDSEQFPMQADITSLLPASSDILEAEENGYLISDQQFIAYTAPDRMGWQYLWIIPYSRVTEEVRQFLFLSIIVLAGFLVAGLAASWMVNRRLYQPIDRFKQDISRLQTNQREDFAALKQAFLRKLLLEEPPKGTVLQQELLRYSSGLDPDGKAAVLMIKFDHTEEFEKEYSPADASLLRYAVLNIACELLGKRCAAEGVDLSRNSMAVIITFSKWPFYDNRDAVSLLTSIRDAVAQHLFQSVSLGMSDPGEFHDLPALCLRAQETLFQRLFTGPGSVLVDRGTEQLRDYPYPEKKEKALSDALFHGNLEKAKKLYLELIGDFRGAPIYAVNTAVLRLVSMCNSLATGIPQLKSRPPFFINLEKIETFDQLHETFYAIFSAITIYTAAAPSPRSGQQVEAINREIEVRFSDPSLSIDSIAATLGLSASYTGRIYKQATGITILERILQVRMDKARTILRETDAPVASVSEMTGFSSDSYFYKIFKQENGVTPAAYRKQFLKK